MWFRSVRSWAASAVIVLVSGCNAFGTVPVSPRATQAALHDLPPPPAFSWPQPGINAGHAAYNGVERKLGRTNVKSLTQAWSFATGAEIGNPIVTDGSTAYVDSGDGYLYAVDVKTGTQKWKFETYWGNAWATSPAIGKFVYAPCLIGGNTQKNGLCALDKSTGKLKWSYYDDCSCLPNSGVEQGPVVSGSTVVIGYYDRDVYRNYTLVAFDASTGSQRWQTLAGNNQGGYGLSNSTPASDGSNVYAGTGAGLCSYGLANGNVNWCSGAGDGGMAPTVANGVVYTNTFSSGFFAYDASTGSQMWQYPQGGSGGGGYDDPPAIAKGTVYFSGEDQGYLYALNASSGSLIFDTSPGGSQSYTRSSPSVANGVVYVACDQGLCAYNASTGKVLLATGSGDSILGSPAIANGRVYTICGYNNACMYDLSAPARREGR